MCDIITVNSQRELDQIPVEFYGTINIKFGSSRMPANITGAHSNAEIIAHGNSIVTARGNATVIAKENAIVTALENSTVTACGKASVTACGKASVTACGNSTVISMENSTVTALENSTVTAHGYSTVTAWENASVIARENSTVTAWANSTVTAWENTNVTAWDNASVTARGNSQVCDITEKHSISADGNARIVYMPKNGIEYCDFYDIQTHDGVGVFYKAVRKRKDGALFSDYDHSFVYEVGAVSTAEIFDNDPTCACSHGIHMAYMDWAYQFGAGWDDLAIIEVEAKLDDIVVPPAAGKVRAPSVKVIREVPPEEYEKLLRIRR